MIAEPDASQAPHLRLWLGLKPYAAPALIFLAIVVAFLRFHEYGLLLPESLILMAGAVILGLGVSVVARLRRATLGPAIIALSLCVYVYFLPDINGQLLLRAGELVGPGANIGLVLGVVATTLFLTIWAICILFGRHLETILVVTFSTIILTTIVLPTNSGGEPVDSGTLAAGSEDLPPLIHVILDEHIGLAGISDATPAGRAAARSISNTFKDFELYPRAFSRFAETKYSLTALFNGDLGVEAAHLVTGDRFQFSPTRNRWFHRLKAQGYAIRVYQSAWFDMCGPSLVVDSCYTYPLFSPNPIQRTPLSVPERLKLLALKLVFGMPALQLGPLASTEAVERLSSDIGQAPRGVAYIVHLLLPHFGYLYESDCSLADPDQWKKNGAEGGNYTAAQREELYARYFGQVTCTAARMHALFARLRALGVYDEATIIVHGDHGSRIGEHHYIVDEAKSLSAQDLLDHFATLLAVKAPGVAPGVRESPVVLQRFFAERFLPEVPLAEPGSQEVLVRGLGQEFGSRQLVWPGLQAPAGVANFDLSELRR